MFHSIRFTIWEYVSKRKHSWADVIYISLLIFFYTIFFHIYNLRCFICFIFPLYYCFYHFSQFLILILFYLKSLAHNLGLVLYSSCYNLFSAWSLSGWKSIYGYYTKTLLTEEYLSSCSVPSLISTSTAWALNLPVIFTYQFEDIRPEITLFWHQAVDIAP